MIPNLYVTIYKAHNARKSVELYHNILIGIKDIYLYRNDPPSLPSGRYENYPCRSGGEVGQTAKWLLQLDLG